MEELGIECRVGHPAEIRAAEPRKQKHDRRDADLILKLLVENRFPAIWRADDRVFTQRIHENPGLAGLPGAIDCSASCR
jgi:hypothetical protein